MHANVTICLFNVVAKLTKLQYTYTPSKNSNRMTYSKLWWLIYILVSKKLISCLTRFDKKCFLVIQMPIRLKPSFQHDVLRTTELIFHIRYIVKTLSALESMPRWRWIREYRLECCGGIFANNHNIIPVNIHCSLACLMYQISGYNELV